MDLDEARPVRRQAIAVGDDLTLLSTSELDQRVAALRSEIDRVELELDRKRKLAAAADALFESSGQLSTGNG